MKRIMAILLFFAACTDEDPVPIGFWELDQAVFTVLSADTLVDDGVFYDSTFTMSTMLINQEQVSLNNFPVVLPDGEELEYRLTLPPFDDLPYKTPIEVLMDDMYPEFYCNHQCSDSKVDIDRILIEGHEYQVILSKSTMQLVEDVVYTFRIKWPPPPCCGPPPNSRTAANPFEIHVRCEYWLSR